MSFLYCWVEYALFRVLSHRLQGQTVREAGCGIVMLVHRIEMFEPENENMRGFAEAPLRKQRSVALGDIPFPAQGPRSPYAQYC